MSGARPAEKRMQKKNGAKKIVTLTKSTRHDKRKSNNGAVCTLHTGIGPWHRTQQTPDRMNLAKTAPLKGRTGYTRADTGCSNWRTQPQQGHWPMQPALLKRPHPTSPPPPALWGRRSLQHDSSPPPELHIGQPSLRPVETARLSNRLRSLGSSYSASARRLNKSSKPQRPQPTAQIRNTLSTKMRKIRSPCETPQIKDPFLCGCKIRNHRGSQKIVTTS